MWLGFSILIELIIPHANLNEPLPTNPGVGDFEPLSQQRVVILPNAGRILVSTDVHGNWDDFAQLRKHYLSLREQGQTYWAILGDVVHAPNQSARLRSAFYDYDDGSIQIIEAIAELLEEFPNEVHLVLGNHDWAHVGGPRTRKFYPDEAAYLENTMSLKQRNLMKRIFNDALICIVTPCGAFLSHGVPGIPVTSLDEINDIDFAMAPFVPRHQELMTSILTSYGQPGPVARAFLESVSTPEIKQNFIIHGHDRDELGYFVDGDTAFCPVIFGAPRINKRYLVLDLAAEYSNSHSLREEHEILRLYGPAPRI